MAKSTTGSARWLFLACKVKTGDSMSKLVLIALADRADDSGACYPSVATLAADCECSKRTVERALSRLESEEFISIQRRSIDGIKTSSIYRINWHASQSRIDTSESRIVNDEIPVKTDASESRIDASICQGVASESRYPSVRESHKPPNETPNETPSKNTCESDDSRLVEISPFDLFWKAYPRKTNKDEARKAFGKASVRVDDLVRDIGDRLKSGHWSLDHKTYIPHASTYLNKKRWKDELIPRHDAPLTAQSVADKTNALLAQIDDTEPF